MNDEAILEQLSRDLREAWRKDHRADVIPLIEHALRNIQDPKNKYDPTLDLACAYRCKGDPAKSEALIRESIELDPGKSDAWISLASNLLYDKDDIDGARRAIEEGLGRARADGSLVRYAYGTLIRIAIKLDDFATVERGLADLLAHQVPPDAMDVKLETDFIARIPEGAVSAELIRQYVEAAAREREPRA